MYLFWLREIEYQRQLKDYIAKCNTLTVFKCQHIFFYIFLLFQSRQRVQHLNDQERGIKHSIASDSSSVNSEISSIFSSQVQDDMSTRATVRHPTTLHIHTPPTHTHTHSHTDTRIYSHQLTPIQSTSEIYKRLNGNVLLGNYLSLVYNIYTILC